MAKAMKDSTVFMDPFKTTRMKSLLAVKATVQMNKTVLSLMTQMRNITTAAMFATANGHIGAGASVSDTFKYLFDDLIGKTKNPKNSEDVKRSHGQWRHRHIYNSTGVTTNDTRAYGFCKGSW